MKNIFLTALILSLTMVSACGKKDVDVTTQVMGSEASATESTKNTDNISSAEQSEQPDNSDATDETATEESSTEEEIKQTVSLDEYELKNDFFGVRFKSYEETPNLYDETQIEATITFEFINLTDETYFVIDNEVQPGGTWEKVIMYPKTKWQDMAGVNSWIHYDLYDQQENEIFKGGLKFVVDEDVKVTEMSIFDEAEMVQ